MRGGRAGSRPPVRAAGAALLGAAAAVCGVRAALLHAEHVGPSAGAFGIVRGAAVGLAVVAALLLLGELLPLVARSTAGRRDAVDRLAAGLCLVVVVVLGVATRGFDAARDDEATPTAVLAVQLLVLAAAVLPAAVLPAAAHDDRGAPTEPIRLP